MKVKIKKLDPLAQIPRYMREGDAGMDLYSVSKRVTDNFIEYGTGLAFEIPKGFVGLVFPRGSVSNTSLIKSNSVGVLDSNYRGELMIRFRDFGGNDYKIGERIAQLIIIPFPIIEFEEVFELNKTNRGSENFGSSGLN